MSLRDRSIPTKMVVLACGSAALGLVSACVGFAWFGVSSLRDAKGRELCNRAEIVAFQAGPAIAVRDRERATEILSSFQTDPTIEEARIYGPDRKIISTWGQQQTVTAPVYNPRGYRFIGYNHVEVLQPVVVGRQKLGTVFVRANTSDLQAGLLEFARHSGCLLALAMLVVVFISKRLQRAISQPILALTQAAQQISLSADTSIRVETAAGAELKTLQDAFNRMLDRLQASEQALHFAHDDLENRVRERTKELSQEVQRRQQTQVALEAAKEAAEAASRAKTEFLANMSHEIRTPLNGIIGFTELLLADGPAFPEAERIEHLRTIRKSGLHLCELINDILDISKIEAGRLELETIPCSPRDIMQDVVSVLRVQATEKGLSLDFDAAELPDKIASDPARLRQLFMNMVGNAVKFTERGGVRVSASVEAQRLKIVVADTGVGIPPEQLEAIFDPFSQADTSVTRRFGGTGLGLAIGRRICESLGGHLTVESKLGSGSVFTAVIAAPQTNPQMDAASRGPLRTVPPAAAESIDLAGRTVLVVDDGETNRKLVRLVLERAGAQVLTAENGLEAVRIVQAEQPEVVFMDMQMPVMDGYSATRQLRADGHQQPIVALTAHAMKGDEQRCLQAGCSDYLSKPVDGASVLETVARWLGQDSPPARPHRVTATTSPTVEPEGIHSTLPLDDPEFCEIVIEFVERLRERLLEMRREHSAGNGQALAQHAHWLKGAGGTAGYHELTEPARELEFAARKDDFAAANDWLHKVEDLASRMVVPQLPSRA